VVIYRKSSLNWPRTPLTSQGNRRGNGRGKDRLPTAIKCRLKGEGFEWRVHGRRKQKQITVGSGIGGKATGGSAIWKGGDKTRASSRLGPGAGKTGRTGPGWRGWPVRRQQFTTAAELSKTRSRLPAIQRTIATTTFTFPRRKLWTKLDNLGICHKVTGVPSQFPRFSDRLH
jgi:hypothetical protein